MNSKKMFANLFANQIENGEEIFQNIDLFLMILPCARDAAREMFSVQSSRLHLVSKIDDIGPMVDDYMLSRVVKIHEDAHRKHNKLYYSFKSTQETVEWIIDRWINIFINLVSNRGYKNYFDTSKIILQLSENIDKAIYSDIEQVLDFEKLKKFSKIEIIKGLNVVWEDVLYDDEFEIDDFTYLCDFFNLTLIDVLGFCPNQVLKVDKIQDKSANFQLIFNFDEENKK